MRLKLLACEVFTREVCYCIANSPHVVDPEFTKIASHNNSDELRRILQKKIDEVGSMKGKYDAFLLLYGLCGNATVGLFSHNIKIIIPRAHDCGSLLLGSSQRFKECFGDNLSQSFCSVGHWERSKVCESEELFVSWYNKNFEEYKKLYGEDNARYLQKIAESTTLDEKVVYIEIPETKIPSCSEKVRLKAKNEKREYSKINGDIRLIRNLIHGNWDDKKFLIMKPNQKTVGIYDWDKVIEAEDAR